MDEILGIDVRGMASSYFQCSCGRNHSVDIKRIIIGSHVLNEVVSIASLFKAGRLFVMADCNTYKICGSDVASMLQQKGFDINQYVFDSSNALIPDERALGRLLVEIENDTSLIIAVGSGSLNDMAKMLSSKLRIPYMIVCTAPSMDGYASVVSPLIIEGFKKTYHAVYPYAILADIDIITQAPMDMLRAGFGDILGKFTALCDWELSSKLTGEYYCETSVKLVRNALQKCIENAGGIEKRDRNSITYIMEALVLSGIAMGLAGNSRPASGAEHHLAHYWEMDALAKGLEHPLHGNSVGVASVVISYIYEFLDRSYNIGVETPKPEYIKALLKRAGSHYNPFNLGIDKELFRDSIMHAKEIRPRYTILQLASEYRLLEEIAEYLTKVFYGAVNEL